MAAADAKQSEAFWLRSYWENGLTFVIIHIEIVGRAEDGYEWREASCLTLSVHAVPAEGWNPWKLNQLLTIENYVLLDANSRLGWQLSTNKPRSSQTLSLNFPKQTWALESVFFPNIIVNWSCGLEVVEEISQERNQAEIASSACPWLLLILRTQKRRYPPKYSLIGRPI